MSDEPIFSTLEIDTIGEIMNISMGSAATAASTLLDNKVTITTPIVNILKTDDFDIALLEPAIAVQIKYVEGISGSNILILRQEDCKIILSQMMQSELPEDYVIDEMATSAICELMNQMMGSSATVLSCFLGRPINISTPQTITIEEFESFKQEHLPQQSHILSIKFTLSIENLMESEFVSVMEIDLAKEIISASLNFDTQDEAPPPEPEPAPPPPPPPPPMPDISSAATPPADIGDIMSMQQPPQVPIPPPQMPMPQTPMMDQQSAQMQPQQPGMPGQGGYPPMQPGYGYPPQYGQYPPQGYPPQAYPQPMGYPAYPPPPQHPAEQPQPILIKEYDYNDFGGGAGSREHPANLDLVMNVPVTVTVELGRTKRKIKEILEFGQGTVVELDKQAGSHVDVIVNGQLIAHGDVVVVDDNFSIRITEILKARDSLMM